MAVITGATGASAPSASPATPASAALGSAKLTTRHAIGQALAIGPLFSVGAVMATVAAVSGYNTPLAILLAFVGSVAFAYVLSLYARRYVGAGAMYEYLAKGVTNSFGIFSAGVYVLGVLFIGAGGLYIGIGYLTQGFFLAHLHTGIPFWVGGAAALTLASYLNYRGVRVAVSGVLALAMVSSIPFIILSLVIIAKGGVGGNTLAVFDPSRTSWSTVFKGILFAVTLFIGFEAAASVAEESENPRRSIPIAVIATVAITGALYLLTAYAATIGFGQAALGAKNAWAIAPSAFGVLANHYVGGWLSFIIDLTIIVDAVSVAIAFMVTGSRMFFALGRDGLLPKAATSTTRHNTPLAGIIVIIAWSVVMLIWAGTNNYGAALHTPNTFALFLIAGAAGGYLIQLIYIFLSLAGFRLVWRSRHTEGGLAWKIPVVILGLSMPVLAYKGSLDPFPTYPLNRGAFIAIAMIVLSAGWWLVLRLTRPDQIKQAARHALQVAATPPETAESLVTTSSAAAMSPR
jgi:amino acid transporter